MEQDAVTALSDALGRIGIAANVLSTEPSAGKRRVDAVVEAAGQRFDVEVESVVTAAQGALLAGTVSRDVPLIVVADRIAADAKRSLREAGVNYFDRRGELRIVSPPLFVDTLVESALPMAGGRSGSLDSQVANQVTPLGRAGAERLLDDSGEAVDASHRALPEALMIEVIGGDEAGGVCRVAGVKHGDHGSENLDGGQRRFVGEYLCTHPFGFPTWIAAGH